MQSGKLPCKTEIWDTPSDITYTAQYLDQFISQLSRRTKLEWNCWHAAYVIEVCNRRLADLRRYAKRPKIGRPKWMSISPVAMASKPAILKRTIREEEAVIRRDQQEADLLDGEISSKSRVVDIRWEPIRAPASAPQSERYSLLAQRYGEILEQAIEMRRRCGPALRFESKQVRELVNIELDSLPPFDRYDGAWVKNGVAANLENIEVETLATYRRKGMRRGLVGRDNDGRIWRRPGTEKSHPWYLRCSLKTQRTLLKTPEKTPESAKL